MDDKPCIAVWFSCGAASAVAAKKTIEKYGKTHNIRVLNTPIAEEDIDNKRFLLDVQEWIGIEIESVIHPDFPNSSAVEVWEAKKAMSFVNGAPCTQILKKHARFNWEKHNRCDAMVFGFTSEEWDRHKKFSQAEIIPIIPILIEQYISKNDCFRIIEKAGIELPNIYKRGYPNANCIGCVKATSPTYWNLVRKEDPKVFEERAGLSRKLGVKLVRVKGERIFLDELSVNAKGNLLESSFDCNGLCGSQLSIFTMDN